MNPSEHLAAAIRSFMAPERRARYVALLDSDAGRDKLRRGLAHLRDLDPRFATRIAAADATPTALAALLVAKGAPTRCVLLSEDAALDGRELPLADALAAVVGRGMGTFVSCIPGVLALYEGEDAGERYLLERPR